MKKEYGYPTLKVICQASAGNETAIREILKFYDAYICKLCLRPFYHSESGKIIMQVDEELKGQIHTQIFVLSPMLFLCHIKAHSIVVNSW